MAGFSTSLSDMKQDAYELEVIASKLRKKSGTLDRLSVKAQAHSRNAGRQIANANRQLGEEVKMISKMSETLQCIAGMYDGAENEIAGLTSEMLNIAKKISVLGGDVATGGLECLQDDLKLEMGMDEYSKVVIEFIGNALYSGLLSKDVEERTKELIEGDYLSNNNFVVSSVLQETSGYTKDCLEPFENVQNIIQWLEQDDEIEIPVIGKMIDCVKTIDLGIDLIRGFEDFVVGMTQDDSESLAKGGKELTKAMMKYLGKIKWTKQEKVIAPDILNPVKLLGSYATNMVTGFIDGITDENSTMQGIVYETFIDSGLNVSVDAVEETANAGIGLVYTPISWVADKFGVDVDSVYEKHSDKKGVFAAMDNVSQVADLIKENSSWESWTSGLKVMGKGIKNGLKKLFS
ncbi:MAG: hypothetical protein IKB07_11135 [Lachnospiraceae bacterium]|nr:hypothetical protein [Lachnospiraceae bacterium]